MMSNQQSSFLAKHYGLIFFLLLCRVYSLQPANLRQRFPKLSPFRLHSDRFNRDLDERSRSRAQGEGAGEMAAGAILGGLLLGPFGR